jgi:exopolysaccharide biosynthesis polyprenyl glycosylphosphotransferase
MAVGSQSGLSVPLPVSSAPREAGWTGRYLRSALAADAGAALMAGVLALELRFGSHPRVMTYLWFTFALPAVWLSCVALARGYEPRFIGAGADEFRRVINAGVGLIAVVAVVSSMVEDGPPRGYVFVALPSAVTLDLAARYWLRKRLHRERARGGCMRRAVAVGHRRDVARLVRMLQREPHHGLAVVAACLAGPGDGAAGIAQVAGVPVHGGPEDVVTAVRDTGADTVAVLACPEINAVELRTLAWALEKTGTDLCLAPALLDIAGPRTSIHPVAGLPLVHVDHPSLTGARQVAKSVFDKLAAIFLLLLLAPLLVAIALAVRLDDGGPALSGQLRIGRNNRPFRRYVFRTLAADGERPWDALTSLGPADGGLLTCQRNPAVTRTGVWLRRWSLDRLPQLMNILLGQMSLVGPRALRPEQAMRYSDHMRWRLDVRPGITGLWLINGAADLPWDEAVRLDLRYVENWSFALDLQILWKTWSAVTAGTGTPEPRVRPPGSVSQPRLPAWAGSVLVLHRVADRLHPDGAVAEHERVDAVLDAGLRGVGRPLEEQYVALVDLGLQPPAGVRHVGEQLDERLPDAVLAALDPRRGDADRVVGVVGDDLLQVAGAERLGVVGKDFLGRARHRSSLQVGTSGIG